MKKIDFELEVLNWDKHQESKKKPTKMLWFKMEGGIFFDARFSTLCVNSKLFFVYLLSECCRANAGTVKISCSIVAKISGIRVNFVRKAVDDLESLQLVKVLTRRKDPPENRVNGNRNSRVEKSSSAEKNMLQNQHEIGTIETSKSQTAKQITKTESKSAATWECYSRAYRKRYGVEPIRNLTINSQLKSFVERIGEQEAPEVAAYFVMLNDPWYTKQGHSVGILLKDAEKLRTMCLTGRRTTAIDPKTAHYIEQMQAIESGEL